MYYVLRSNDMFLKVLTVVYLSYSYVLIFGIIQSMIKKLRLLRGWSQEKLAETSNLSVRTIQRIERGHNIGLTSLNSIAKSLDVSIMKLQSQNKFDDELFLGATPILPVESVIKTANFYTEKLGFEIEVLWQEPPYGVVARGQVTIEFGEGRKKYSGSGVCNIFVNDVDAVYQEFKDKNIEFVDEIADRDYGSRDFRIKDNNGNILILTSHLINQKELLNAGNTK